MEEKKKFRLVRLTKDNILSFKHYFDQELMNALATDNFDGVGLLKGRTAAGGFILQDRGSDTHSMEIHAFKVHSEYSGTGGEELLLRAAEAMARDKGKRHLVYRYMDEEDEAAEFFGRAGFEDYGVTGEIINISRKELKALLTDKSSSGDLARKSEEKLRASLKGGRPYKEALILKKVEGGFIFSLDLGAAHGSKEALGLIWYALDDACSRLGNEDVLSICVEEEEAAVYDKLFGGARDIDRQAVYILQKDVQPSIYDFTSDSFIYFAPRLNALTDILLDLGLEGDLVTSEDNETVFELRVPKGEPARYLSYVLSFEEEEGHRIPGFATRLSTYIDCGTQEKAREMMDRALESDLIYCDEDYPEEGVISVNALLAEGLEMPSPGEYQDFLNGYEREMQRLFGIKALTVEKAAQGLYEGGINDGRA
ncbi:MAG: hypothetical protein J6O71_04820 [Lachnospiraceae bacterium]|nr:hypothetical protein [Lachnospiraceae bacterium]